MIYYKIVYSKEAPNVRNVVWMKPVDGGFTMYIYDGAWKPLKLVNDAETKYNIGDDKVMDVEEKFPDKFSIIVTSVKEGVEDSDIAPIKQALHQGIDSQLYNLWSKGPIEFNFVEPDDNGRNLVIKADNLEMRVAVAIDDSGSDDVVTFGTPQYIKGNPSYKNAFLTTYFSNLITELDASAVGNLIVVSE